MKAPNGDPLLEVLPGLVGEIARYVDSTLENSCAQISIPAALSFVSALKSKRYEVPEKVAPNLYCCVVASSGTGKSQAQRAIQDLVLTCGMNKMLMGKPASDSGLLKSLQDEARRLLIWDEFGIALSELSKSNASYRALILSTLMDLFSSSGKVYLGKEYSSQARVDIKEPYLSIFGASTPNRFFGALNQDFVEDGFLSRWLLFFVPEETPKTRPAAPDANEIIERIIQIENAEKSEKGNLAKVFDTKRIMVKFDKGRKKLRKADFKAMLKSAKTEIQRIFWSRGYEQYLKVATVLCDDGNGNFEIDHFAAQIVQDLIKGAIEKCENCLYSSEREKTKEKFKALILPGQTATLSMITKRSYRLNLSRSERMALIDDLVDAGFWQKRQEEVDGRKKVTCFTAV